ncbi:carbonic anhydrase 4b isoform X2 [Eleginops maclovinus]|uniref:carbonic anhydrase 4b isoform X2 n=1 Tax=Eleginops maclovinus TaxID=56733 RepID=UPI0030801B28
MGSSFTEVQWRTSVSGEHCYKENAFRREAHLFSLHWIPRSFSWSPLKQWSHRIKIIGGSLASQYKAIQLHLHWGKDGGPGSEHTIDGEQFPMEMHIVHIKEEYNSLSQAVGDSTGVAVLGFFFEESKSANKKFDPLIKALKNITQPSNSTALEGVSLEMFTPSQENMTKYLRYNGSLTTPDCAEAVIWSLFENTVPLSRKQLAEFSNLQFSNGEQMTKTFRPLQPLNGRQVYYSGGQVALVSTVLLIVSVLVSLMNEYVH